MAKIVYHLRLDTGRKIRSKKEKKTISIEKSSEDSFHKEEFSRKGKVP